MTVLKGEQCSNQSVGVCAPARISLVPVAFSLVSFSPDKFTLISVIESSAVPMLYAKSGQHYYEHRTNRGAKALVSS